MLRSAKPKTARGKRAQERRQPQVIENVKRAMVLRGATTSETVNTALQDLYALKKPDAVYFSKKNEILPFEDDTKLEFLTQRNDTSLFLLGTHSKKRPHNLVMGRMFDFHILDMLELGIEYAIPAYVFDSVKCAVGSRPLFLFQGDVFDQREDYSKFKSLLIDFFHGEEIHGIDLKGIQHLISVTAGPFPDDGQPGLIFFRVFALQFKKSGTRTPRVELQEMGPAFDFRIRRTRFADHSIWKEATRVPKELQLKKTKNVSRDGLGDTYGRIHLGDQKLDDIQTRKMKALKRIRREKMMGNMIDDSTVVGLD
ncbi:rRNA-binding ribosome biosynthesis protein rpf2 [Dispira parvispora]|uniref:Ribosome production factor 2 homolog n=1 Tax=Dispira parvispora TaxID=1520584 RepID=A0A9W8E5I3_9FUNG|nr:rRNA-binding ribosome biosynthesis protein rpf2 [Dispira parvispora]